jgi:hypothetical protein
LRLDHSQLSRPLEAQARELDVARVSVERNAVAPIGKPMALRHIAAEDEHRDVDAGAGNFAFPAKKGGVRSA